MKLLVLTYIVSAFLLAGVPAARAVEEVDNAVEETTTESPIAEMASVGPAKSNVVKITSIPKIEKDKMIQHPSDSKQHTIADFIIHPLIALKPRLPETESVKQSNASSTASSPWQLFNFSPGQGLGSLAGTVTGWLGNRIQLPGLVDTPVREATTTTTTTSTIRPDVVVKIQHRPAAKKPFRSVTHSNYRPYRNSKNPNRFNANYLAELVADYDDYGNFRRQQSKRRRYQAVDYVYDADDDDVNDGDAYEMNASNEANEDDEEAVNYGEVDNGNISEKKNEAPVKHKKLSQTMQHNKIRKINDNRRGLNNQQRRQEFLQQGSAEDYQYEDIDGADDDDEAFYYNQNPYYRRSQNEMNFIRRGQQSLLQQIKQLTRVQAAVEDGNILRKTKPSATNKQRQPIALLVNHNGQAFYLATKRGQVQHYQTPVSVAHKRKPAEPMQYITIPWSQLGISSTKKSVPLNKNVSSKPLILRTPIKTPPVVAAANKTIPARLRPTTVTEKVPAANEHVKEKQTSSSEEEDDDESTQYLVVGDEAVGTELSRSAYRKILNSFHRNRKGRQANHTNDPTKEQLIPVKIVTDNEEPAKVQVTTRLPTISTEKTKVQES